MTFPGRDMRQGTFTAGTAGSSSTIPTTVNVNCGFNPSKVELINMTLLNTTMAGGPPVINPGSTYLTYRAVWQQEFASSVTPFTLVEALAPAASVTNVSVSSVGRVTSNGISAYNGQVTPPSSSMNSLVLGPTISGTNTNTNGTFTISSTATLYVGATVLMTKNSVNKQLGGMYFTVDSVASSTTFTIANSAGWLNTASFTNGAETFKVQLVSVPPYYYPSLATIVNISAANPAVVTTSVSMGLSAGQVVRLRVPSGFGMTQANNVTAIISSVSKNQITLGGTTGTINLNNGFSSVGFTAFAWPLVTAVPFNYATVTPVGGGPVNDLSGTFVSNTLSDATVNTSYNGFIVGSGILNTASSTVFGVTAGDVFAWTAWGADQ